MTTLFILIGVCIWVLGFPKLEALGALVVFLEFCSLDCGFIIFLLSLFVMQTMSKNLFTNFLIGK